jgi:phosphoribosylformimino-5-aminoimidazole carboxamide ribonucleotide (ProFAR) isomerase
LAAFLTAADGFGLGGFLVNACDASLEPTTAATLRSLASTCGTPVWIGGSALDLSGLDTWSAAGVKGAVLGRELYDGGLKVEETLKRYEPAIR